ncbi:MAG TPA: flagellar motor protein MotB [Gemmatimonadaceae bacterium]|nr:flagellar motor protein MotB [Gemmatimonadaceae bacterium]
MAKDGGRKIVIVRKKSGGHGGHHGGAWKVAYADFVTAMMAFFMVLWIVGLDDQTKKAVEGYFANPVGTKNAYSGGASPVASGSSPARVSKNALKLIVRKVEEQQFRDFQKRIAARIDSNPSLATLKGSIEVIITKDGLRIELVEKGSGEDFFPQGSAVLRPRAVTAIALIAEEIGLLSNPLILEGHTDGAPFGIGGSYTNWELSADRANAARRVVVSAGVPNDRLVQVRGLADRDLRNPNDPFDPTNRRISIFLPFRAFDDPNAKDSTAAAPPSATS